ncbi:hypothetical protein CRD36_10170 [Paremcibacter congregatus]|uniref:Uncharacterized protein n=1 Tax=Paremcibacter congregatus TaxID=2043170 RepID=A0A2G4YR69_9PROT|nr:hypothetical protein CRD36_10170 [Paremcibacter congregatus]
MGRRYLAPDQRKALLVSVADQIDAACHELALLGSLDMGMPISMSLEQVEFPCLRFKPSVFRRRASAKSNE